MSKAIGMVQWSRGTSNARAAHVAAYYVTAYVIHDDGSVREEHWTEGGEDGTPSHLKSVPVVASGGRDACGGDWGLDFAGFRAGKIQNGVADDSALWLAAVACWQALGVTPPENDCEPSHVAARHHLSTAPIGRGRLLVSRGKEIWRTTRQELIAWGRTAKVGDPLPC